MMQPTKRKKTLKAALLALTILLLAGTSLAQVSLTAGAANATLPDGTVVPMWGYTCGAVGTPGVSCASLSPNAGSAWSPIVITVATGTDLNINLANSLPVPTSLTIVGQLGGGLGNTPTRTTSPNHPTQTVTWPIAGDNTGATFNPPAQGDRVQSFGTEVGPGASQSLSWKGLRPGTYLIESGTHPSIQGPMGLYGVLIVTTPPSQGATGTAYPAPANVSYSADLPLLLSEIDAVQNKAVDFAVHTSGFSETAVWSGQPGQCGNPKSANYGTCYPPAVNYDPRYYLVNGVAFDKTNAGSSSFPVSAPATTGQVLVRFVNAGLRMHVPSIVGAQTGSSPAFPGFSLIAEDGNVLPGTPRIQSEVFLAAGKTYDVMINAPSTAAALPVFDRELSLSTNNQRDGGMQAYISLNGGGVPNTATAAANDDTYLLVAGSSLIVNDPTKGVVANDINVYGVHLKTPPANGTLTFNQDGTFSYVPNAGATSDSFVYYANNNPNLTAKVTLGACTGSCIGRAPSVSDQSYTSTVATQLQIARPGVLTGSVDPSGHQLAAQADPANPLPSWLKLAADGSFIASPGAAGVYTFKYQAKNSQGTLSNSATVTLTFPSGSGMHVSVIDGKSKAPVSDYRWIIEEDRTFQIDPNKQVNTGSGAPPTFGVNFHTSYMPLVAAGCVGTLACEDGQTFLNPETGSHDAAVCDGNGTCRTDAKQQTQVDPSQVALDPTKHYYISVLPGDGANPFIAGDFTDSKSGHTMGGAPVTPQQAAGGNVTVIVEPTPLPTAKLAVFVFEDDNPLNGEVDTGGGVDTLATNEPGLGGFEITLFDNAGGTGDATGQMTYDMFNMPLSNSLAGTIDPATGNDACPITSHPADSPNGGKLVGMIVTCPYFESDGTTPSPLTGQAIVANMMPGRYGVVATPAADRIARGEEWLQTNTLDGQKAHDSFMRVGGPPYFQEFGPAGYHVTIGFANPAKINAVLAAECAGAAGLKCRNSVKGRITNLRLSRPPNENLYGSGSRDAFGWTQCYVSIGDTDGADEKFAKCDSDGNFSLTGIPDGSYRMSIFDQWNDQLVAQKPITLPDPKTQSTDVNVGDLSVLQWHTNLYTRTFFDLNGDGVSQENEPGLTFLPTNIRFRDGSYSNFNNTDLNGYASFNEVFPLFSWYVAETDTLRYKQTGVHVVYDAGGPADGTPGGGNSTIAANLANTHESATAHLPVSLRVPGAVYCDNGDCAGYSIANGPQSSAASPSTARIDPPNFYTYGWQGFAGQSSFLEFGMKPFATGENGGIRGEVTYASTRPFDDPALLIHTSWTPNVPGVTINLYQEGNAADGTTSLKLVDTTKTTSWDDWAQGFRTDGAPNMNCPGQETTDPFYNYTLYGSTQWLNPSTHLPNNSQFKCYDGMHNLNQLQPAPYDGMYRFPSVISYDPATGKPASTNCTVCTANPTGDGTQMLPAGKYVVEVVVPPGYELVKEEDKNILIGDNFIAPVSQQFAGLGNIFILPDQAAVGSSYNPGNAQNSTVDLGSTTPTSEGDTGSVEVKWTCVGDLRVVPDYLSLFPQAQEVAPFAGASRNLCDRKEVILEDQMTVRAKFWVFSSTHVAAHFTGFILDDFSSEFDPNAPDFGEKFAVPTVPIAFKDWAGNEISRTYSDQWGMYNGLNYSTWEVNPPNPTGYGPTMMTTCMNDPGPIPGPNGTMITDPLYNSNYSDFCYDWPFMPGQTAYMDTPVVPVSAFAEGYNPPDCAYPDATPGVKEVDGDGIGPWVSASGKTLTINALGDLLVPNHSYSGPAATTAPYNQKFITRHYGFGGTQGTGSVSIAGINAPVTFWSDDKITVTVPAISNSASTCQIAQRSLPNNVGQARCGELVITSGNGKQSIDAVTVTVGGKAPTVVAPNGTIQTAIDNATPGDLIMVSPGTYNEFLLMWKPVRLQGVGAASTVINANPHPSGNKLDPWRRQVACLFGVAVNGGAISQKNPFDPTGTFTCSSSMQSKVDTLPLEPTVGWDATLNGNIAELLLEPTLMGAYEGAAITVLAKGVSNPVQVAAGTDPILLTDSDRDCRANLSNFKCNPSRVDGFTFTNSSQGGGGIFLHGWNHYIEVANNRVHSNAGTLTGGITIGQAETTDGTIAGTTQLAFAYNTNINIHNNAVTQNAAYGDELNSTTPGSAGGVTFCTGSDNYKFKYNWVCGNLSTGDGGGFAHLGFTYNGDIEHNLFLFNQSFNPTIVTYGGGLEAEGAPPDGTACENAAVDLDCPPQLSDGVGPGLTINANLFMGNTAESGSGGGLRLQSANGTDVQRNPSNPRGWHKITVTNNIIANNVAGWTGAGVSLEDAVNVDFINNTVVSNDSTASAGILFDTLGAANSNVPPPGCDPAAVPADPKCINPVVTSTFQPAGLSSEQNSVLLRSAFTNPNVNCPQGHPNCTKFSNPVLDNNLFWQNRTFHIQVGGLDQTIPGVQNAVALVPQLNQINHGTGYCQTQGAIYWDLGVYGDSIPANSTTPNHASGLTMNPLYSIIDDPGYGSTNKTPASAGMVSQYCNGSRIPPEIAPLVCSSGANAPGCNGGGQNGGGTVTPGAPDLDPLYPLFTLNPAATVDEGNNFINMFYGPLSLSNTTVAQGGTGYGKPLGDYSLAAGSPAIDAIPRNGNGTTFGAAPNTDFFGNMRPSPANPNAIDIGAVEFYGAASAPNASINGPLAFGNVAVGSTSTAQTLTLSNTGGSALNGITLAFSTRYARAAAGGTCGATLAANSTCTISVVFQPAAPGLVTGSLTVTAANGTVTGSPVTLTGTGAAAASVSINPNPLRITLPTGTATGTGTVTLMNTSAVGGSSVTITNVAVAGNSGISWLFNKGLLPGNDSCTGATLAPQQTCTVLVRFTNISPATRGTDHPGTITFTDSASGSPQTGALVGHAN